MSSLVGSAGMDRFAKTREGEFLTCPGDHLNVHNVSSAISLASELARWMGRITLYIYYRYSCYISHDI